MWNELNYERMQLFKKRKLTREAMRETYKKYYKGYKRHVRSATAQQVINVNNVSLIYFLGMLKAKKEEKLQHSSRGRAHQATRRIEF